ncbi:ABC transporter permease subunit [Suttonella sp. R2A3]|uniref:amino acid ABC transporter permease n=1 Tax=Suttonella sp. R2A3 TaxID=2908648 RepID=UPI001EEB0664|nr:ABC transporter permease subunit [Suttonella sp. R2A3]UJF25057.1 ABC transporter permease subunit [Suttonella sp. R2A3]
MQHTRLPLRAHLFQLALAAMVIVFVVWIGSNVQGNLSRIGQHISFDFLSDPANFPVSQSLIRYDSSDSYLRVFWVGLLNTLLISALSVITATLIGVVIGIIRISPNWLLRKLAAVFVEVFRNVPLLLQLFFWYFAVLAVLPSPRTSDWVLGCDAENSCLAALTNRGLDLAKPLWTQTTLIAVLLALVSVGVMVILWWLAKRHQQQSGKRWRLWPWFIVLLAIAPLFWFSQMGADDYSLPQLKGFNYRGGLTILPELAALWLALTLYSAAYVAEYVRAGIQAVSKGQYEAAAAIGLGSGLSMRLVILPQALRVIIPPLTNQYLNIVKNSSLATAIAYPDLVSVFTGTALNQTGRSIEIIVMTMAVYLTISLIIALLMNTYNRRKQLVSR